MCMNMYVYAYICRNVYMCTYVLAGVPSPDGESTSTVSACTFAGCNAASDLHFKWGFGFRIWA